MGHGVDSLGVRLAIGVAVIALAACKTGKTPAVAARDPLADSADQVFYHAKSRVTDQGVMKSELHADTGYFFDDNTRIEMRVDTMYFFTVTGAPNAVLTSREATYNTRTGNMEARGNVIVTGVDGRRLTTAQLRYAQAQNQISSDSAFVVTDTTHRQTTGVGFTSDPDMNNVRCLGDCAGTAGVVNLTSTAPDSTHRGPAPPAPASPSGVPTTVPSSGANPASAGAAPPPRARAVPAPPSAGAAAGATRRHPLTAGKPAPTTGAASTGVPSTGVPSTGVPSTGVPSTGAPAVPHSP
jgi:LPS export ABC transporter protein LptC